MKTLRYLSVLLACALMATTAFTSCEWDDSPEPDHPLFVTYTVSATDSVFVGPAQLLLDIEAWIRANHDIRDVEVSYSTGEASEFAKTDAEAVKRYEAFAPKFKAYLQQEVYSKLKKGDYGTNVTVDAIFHIFATRTQGEKGTLRYESLKFSYPDTPSNN